MRKTLLSMVGVLMCVCLVLGWAHGAAADLDDREVAATFVAIGDSFVAGTGAGSAYGSTCLRTDQGIVDVVADEFYVSDPRTFEPAERSTVVNLGCLVSGAVDARNTATVNSATLSRADFILMSLGDDGMRDHVFKNCQSARNASWFTGINPPAQCFAALVDAERHLGVSDGRGFVSTTAGDGVIHWDVRPGDEDSSIATSACRNGIWPSCSADDFSVGQDRAIARRERVQEIAAALYTAASVGTEAEVLLLGYQPLASLECEHLLGVGFLGAEVPVAVPSLVDRFAKFEAELVAVQREAVSKANGWLVEDFDRARVRFVAANPVERGPCSTPVHERQIHGYTTETLLDGTRFEGLDRRLQLTAEGARVAAIPVVEVVSGLLTGSSGATSPGVPPPSLPPTLPGKPSCAAPSNGMMEVTWSAADGQGTALGSYLLEVKNETTGSLTHLQPTGTRAGVGVAAENIYRFRVTARSAAGSTVGAWSERCSTRQNPHGAFDEISSPQNGVVRIRGWAIDPSDLGHDVRIHAYVGGRAGSASAEGHSLVNASLPRGGVRDAWVGAYPSMDANVGFDVEFGTKKTGPQEVCVYAINVGSGTSNPLLGCKTVTINHTPFGALDLANSPSDGKIRVRGWAIDPSDLSHDVRIHVYVGGEAGTAGAEGHSLTNASKSRADVHDRWGPVFRGLDDSLGFDQWFETDKKGTQPVCVYAINVGSGTSSNTFLGCESVTIVGHPPLGAYDHASSPHNGTIRVRGWSFDPSDFSHDVRIHAYVGGEAGTSNAEAHSLVSADKTRTDVQRVWSPTYPGMDSTVGFDVEFRTQRSGEQPVCLYAINVGGGSNKFLGCKTVNIVADHAPAAITVGADEVMHAAYIVEGELKTKRGDPAWGWSSETRLGNGADWSSVTIDTDTNGDIWVVATKRDGRMFAIRRPVGSGWDPTSEWHQISGAWSTTAAPSITYRSSGDGMTVAAVRSDGKLFTAKVNAAGVSAIKQRGTSANVTAITIDTARDGSMWMARTLSTGQVNLVRGVIGVGWGSWHHLPGTWSATTPVSLTERVDGDFMTAAAVRQDGKVYTVRVESSGLSNLQPRSSADTSTVSIQTASNGDLWMVRVATDGKAHIRKGVPGVGWGSWQQLGGTWSVHSPFALTDRLDQTSYVTYVAMGRSGNINRGALGSGSLSPLRL